MLFWFLLHVKNKKVEFLACCQTLGKIDRRLNFLIQVWVIPMPSIRILHPFRREDVGKFKRYFPTFKALTGPLIVCKDLAPLPKIETHTMT